MKPSSSPPTSLPTKLIQATDDDDPDDTLLLDCDDDMNNKLDGPNNDVNDYNDDNKTINEYSRSAGEKSRSSSGSGSTRASSNGYTVTSGSSSMFSTTPPSHLHFPPTSTTTTMTTAGNQAAVAKGTGGHSILISPNQTMTGVVNQRINQQMMMQVMDLASQSPVSSSVYNHNTTGSNNSGSSRSLSASPQTPQKKWQSTFQNYLRNRKEDTGSQNKDGDNNRRRSMKHNGKDDKTDRVDKVTLPDITSTTPTTAAATTAGTTQQNLRNLVYTSKSLPPNYTLTTPNYTLPAFKRKKNKKLIEDQNSLDKSVKYGKPATNFIYSSDEYLSGDSIEYSSDHSKEYTKDYSTNNNHDKSTRGGNIFGKLFQKKKSSESGSSVLDISTNHSRRAKSCDSLLDHSIRGGISTTGSTDNDGAGGTGGVVSTSSGASTTITGGAGILRMRSSSDDPNKRNINYLNTKYGPTGTVIGPDGVIRKINIVGNSIVDEQKQKKMVFTEIRNAADAKDSATAYLGEEKSVHKGNHFSPQLLTSADRSLSTVKEEIEKHDNEPVILTKIHGVDSWSPEQRNLVFPAIAAMCRSEVFETFRIDPKASSTESTNNNNNNPYFGSIILGEYEAAREPKDNTKDEDFKWKKGYFELRQNYLLEYADESSISPRAYAFLQDAKTIMPYIKFQHSLKLEYTIHQGRSTTCTVIIRLNSGVEQQKWLNALQKGSRMKIEDLYEFDNSEGGIELGRGRYATIRPGRRRAPSSLSSSQQQQQHLQQRSGLHYSLQDDKSDSGILKKKPSFSSFSNLTILCQDDYECALKIVDKKLFWKTVERGQERADSIVRETCVQATIMALARQHKGFLQLKSFFETRDKVVLELELLEGTDLYQYIKKKQPLSELEAAKIMYDILGCVVVMKSLGIAHRDLKPANILMANKSNRYGMRVNVGDFGNATFVGKDNLVRGRCGTVGYVAPEIFLAQKNSGYENKVDEFSAGVILYVLLCCYEPFYGETEKEVIKENTRAYIEYPEEDWMSISLEGRDLVEKLLQRDPSKRIDASKALQHPWITRRASRIRQPLVHQGDGEHQGDGKDDDSFEPSDFACVIS